MVEVTTPPFVTGAGCDDVVFGVAGVVGDG
jgi:hypothetical protein